MSFQVLFEYAELKNSKNKNIDSKEIDIMHLPPHILYFLYGKNLEITENLLSNPNRIKENLKFSIFIFETASVDKSMSS